MNKIRCAWCAGLGLGYGPKAPGTWGTLLAWPLLWLSDQWSWPWMLCLWVLLMGLSVYACSIEAKEGEDPQWIVCDEFMAMWLCGWCLPHTWYGWLLGTLAFRLFDIWKPWPIPWIEKAFSPGYAIMLDDTMAALYAWVLSMGLLKIVPFLI